MDSVNCKRLIKCSLTIITPLAEIQPKMYNQICSVPATMIYFVNIATLNNTVR